MEKKQNYTIPIIVMFLLFGMISFVTNLASPMGDILKNQFSIPNWQGTLGVFANFIAYAIMGYPAGTLLQRHGYKKTALVAIAVGFVGVGIQTLSGVFCSFGVYARSLHCWFQHVLAQHCCQPHAQPSRRWWKQRQPTHSVRWLVQLTLWHRSHRPHRPAHSPRHQECRD